MHSLVVLHGQTMNGSEMRNHLGTLPERFGDGFDTVYADAPHECSDGAVDRLYAHWGTPRLPGPYRTWWDASDDGRDYAGWPETRAYFEGLLRGRSRIALFGFSQGAIVAAALVALAEAGELPKIDLAVLVAGRTPRADAIRPYLVKPLHTRSLHVYGTADPLAADAPALSDLFTPDERTVLPWPGGHRVPTTGPASEKIIGAVARWVRG